MIRAYQNKEELEKWGEAARKVIAEKYTWDTVAESLESYLLAILG
jgi:glycosyltransferase involved in cell wall biosynthesis